MPKASGIIAIAIVFATAGAAVRADEQFSPTFGLHDVLQYKFAKNPGAGERIMLQGFSVVPPQGENWIEGPRLPEPSATQFSLQRVLQFAKIVPQKPNAGPHTILASGHIQYLLDQDKKAAQNDPADYMRFMLRLWSAQYRVGLAARGGKLVEETSDIGEDLGFTCGRYDVLAEDPGVPGFPGRVFTFRGTVFQCLAPSREFLVVLDYSQRVPPGVDEVDIAAEGDAFVRSIRFEGARISRRND